MFELFFISYVTRFVSPVRALSFLNTVLAINNYLCKEIRSFIFVLNPHLMVESTRRVLLGIE